MAPESQLDPNFQHTAVIQPHNKTSNNNTNSS